MISLVDLLMTPVWLLLVYMTAVSVKNRNRDNPVYKYYLKGLSFKIAAGVSVCIIYTVYYDGGFDTTNYFYEGACVMINLFQKSPYAFFKVLLGARTAESLSYFDNTTSWPMYWRDGNAFFFIRLITPLAMITLKSYIATTVILAWLSYTGMWRLFLVFTDVFPRYTKQVALGVLFIPSVAFWGSGVLKDTVTISALGWYTYAFYNFFIKRNKPLPNFFYLVISIYLILSIKPYILYALLPGSLIWLSVHILKKVEHGLVRRLFAPFVVSILLSGAYFFISNLGSSLGKFSVDRILENAVITQRDLKREAYGENKFDIGDYDANLSSMVKKAPPAILAGLYRPFLWEARNPMMLVSGLESAYILYLSFVILLGIPFKRTYGIVKDNPLLLFSVIFALFFSFSVGLTTANFGALVRYRIPALPFWVITLLLIREMVKEEKGEAEVKPVVTAGQSGYR